MIDKWLSRKDACEYLGVSMPTLNRMMASGKITFYKNSGGKSAKTRFRLSDLEKYLRSTKN